MGTENFYFGLGLLLYALYTMVPNPFKTEWWNGNTYIFILPMSLGVILDAVHQIPGYTTIGTTAWNSKIVTLFDLLVIMDSGLIFAFLFTLAFRGVISIYQCYWLCAAGVGCICVHLGLRIPILLWQN